jgi:murein DD-endopeptidase MepM/ murein hydrolase activator NlpD
MVEIRHPEVHGEQFSSFYYHVGGIGVSVGQSVTRGQQIALAGDVGCIIGSGLHLSVRRLTHTNDGNPAEVDPYGWEGSGVDPWSVHPRGASSFWLWLPGQAPLIQESDYQFY